jgi:predicted small secreted protein
LEATFYCEIVFAQFETKHLCEPIERKSYEPRNNIGGFIDTRVDRGSAHVGLQHGMGLRARRHRRVAAGGGDYSGAAREIMMTRNEPRELPTINQPKGKMKTLAKTVVCVLLLVATATAFTGCRTAEGFGEDMEDAGESIQRNVD